MFLTSTDQFEVRLARDNNEILAAQRLRYKVFIEEFGASLPKNDKNERLERDKFDQYCDHLILIDKWSKNNNDGPPVVGTMRLMDSTVAEKALGFYSATEYHLDKLVAKHKNSLEIGRACVDKKYRASIAMHFLWLGLADFVINRNVTLMFGVASFNGHNVLQFGSALTLLKEKFSAPEALGFKARAVGYIDMNIIPLDLLDQKKAMAQMPSLLKAFLRMGARISDGASFDSQFNTIDVGVMMLTDLMNSKYKERYGRVRKK